MVKACRGFERNKENRAEVFKRLREVRGSCQLFYSPNGQNNPSLEWVETRNWELGIWNPIESSIWDAKTQLYGPSAAASRVCRNRKWSWEKESSLPNAALSSLSQHLSQVESFKLDEDNSNKIEKNLFQKSSYWLIGKNIMGVRAIGTAGKCTFGTHSSCFQGFVLMHSLVGSWWGFTRLQTLSRETQIEF